MAESQLGGGGDQQMVLCSRTDRGIRGVKWKGVRWLITLSGNSLWGDWKEKNDLVKGNRLKEKCPSDDVETECGGGAGGIIERGQLEQWVRTASDSDRSARVCWGSGAMQAVLAGRGALWCSVLLYFQGSGSGRPG
jgi:hypothetical protein